MGKTRDTANLISDGNLSVDIVNDRVGIGSTIPQYKLDVVGDINLSGTFRQGGTQFVASRWTTGTGDDIYRLSGNVGIGITNPQGTLQVGTAITMYASSGIVSATSYRGDGSQLTGVGGESDITSSLFT